MAVRARIVLECAGTEHAAVAAKLRTSGFTVGMWRNLFITGGVAALGDEVRPGAPRQIGDDKVERAVRLTLEEAPQGATHWSSRALAAESIHRQSNLAGLRTASPWQRDLPAVQRSAAAGQGARRSRFVHEPTPSRAGAVRGGEEPDSGSEP